MPSKKTRSQRSAKKRKTSPQRKTAVVAKLKGRTVRVPVRPGATPEERAEAAQYAQTLDRNAQIAYGKSLPPGATHQIEKDAEGHDVLIRKRFSAI